jgi:hypothetical protein
MVLLQVGGGREERENKERKVEKGLNVGERGKRRGKWKGGLEEERVKGKRQ